MIGFVPGWPDVSVFWNPQDLPNMLRPSTRRTPDSIYMSSLGVLARYEADLRDIAKQFNARSANVFCKDDARVKGNHKLQDWVCAWRKARKNGAAKVGATNSANKREKERREACALISDRWPMSNDDWRTETLLKEAAKSFGKKKMAYNTAIKYLGKRPLAQANYQAKLKRAERRKAKNV